MEVIKKQIISRQSCGKVKFFNGVSAARASTMGRAAVLKMFGKVPNVGLLAGPGNSKLLSVKTIKGGHPAKSPATRGGALPELLIVVKYTLCDIYVMTLFFVLSRSIAL